jgi:lipopolysaccharide/colanic/teichoic acid biosynthesis glycosyltransferase
VNFVLALLAVIALFLVFLLVGLVVKLSSRGPVFYTQERVGLDRRSLGRADLNHRRKSDLGGEPFTIYKFRTMRVDAERESGAVWAQQDDPRVTPVGRFLGQYRLDELPQLLNVLRGEMNIVGPRPERPSIFAELRGHIAEYPLRQRAKPGITGLAQINHHYDRSLDDVRRKVHFDLNTSGARACGRTSDHADHPRHPVPPRRMVAERSAASRRGRGWTAATTGLRHPRKSPSGAHPCNSWRYDSLPCCADVHRALHAAGGDVTIAVPPTDERAGVATAEQRDPILYLGQVMVLLLTPPSRMLSPPRAPTPYSWQSTFFAM